MCGIVGFVGNNFSKPKFEKNLKLLSHRGPDDMGIFYDEGVGLGHVRLSIQDLSSLGHQPMKDAFQPVTLVFNGEIYNFKELRTELEYKGYQFRGNSDSEVLLKLYLAFKVKMLDKINGIYAFAIWDAREKTLFVARDGVGVKPLYYSETEKGFVFSSELKGLLWDSSVSKELNPIAIAHYLTYLWCPSPNTLLANVLKLEPGHALLVQNKKIVMKWQFYNLPNGKKQRWRENEASAIYAVRNSIQTAVRRQMIADVPVGAFLSGGLDSSAVVAFAKKYTNERLQCFTIDLQGHGKSEGMADDLPYAQQVAKRLNIDLHAIQVGPEIVDKLEKMIWHLDEPQADPAPLNALFISQLAHEHGIKVLLSGAGGDDIFTGYRRHYALQQERYWSWLPNYVRKGLSIASKQIPIGFPISRRIGKAFNYADWENPARLSSYFFWLHPNKVLALLHPDIRANITSNSITAPLIHATENLPNCATELDKMLYLESKFFLADHNLNYTDKMSMAMGVEVRVPLLDPDLINLAASLPDHYKQRGKTGKWIFKKAMEPFLPHEIIYRPKTGFGAPLRHWLKNELKTLVEDILSPETLMKRGIFDPAEVTKLVKNDRNSKIDASYTIFSLVCIELWCQLFIDRPF